MIHGNIAKIGLLLLSTQLSVVAATYTVDTAVDDGSKIACTSAPNDCSLRGVLDSTVSSGDVVDFDLPSNSTIVLDKSGLPSIDVNVTIDGSSVSGLAVSGNNHYLPFTIGKDANVTIQGISIVSGLGSGHGGAIYNKGDLSIVNCTLSGNTDMGNGDQYSRGYGGAVCSPDANSSTRIIDSNITSNNAYVGGAIFGGTFDEVKTNTIIISGCEIKDNNGSFGGAITFIGEKLTVSDSTISGNSADDGAGAIYLVFANSDMQHSVVADNNASDWGGGLITIYGHHSISDSTISGNSTDNVGGAICLFSANLDMQHSVIADNNADLQGGGVYSYNSEVNITSSTITSNSAVEDGGAIFGTRSNNSAYNLSTKISNANSMSNPTVYREAISGDESNKRPANARAWIRNFNRMPNRAVYANAASGEENNNSITISACQIKDNNASQNNGGAIFINDGTLTVSDSTIFGNSASQKGGAIWSHSSDTDVSNSTISGNSASEAGAIYQYGGSYSLTVTHSTIVNNKANTSGGIHNVSSSSSIKNSIISGNTDSSGNSDCFSNDSYYLYSQGHNIVQAPGNCNFTNTGDITGSAPKLGPLADNGGATKTHALNTLTGNIALDTGTCDDIAGNPVTIDQRGVTRPSGSECDIGAFEFGADSDSDGLDALSEAAYGTSPTNADSDSDDLGDGEEVYVYRTDPLNTDTDGDGAKDGLEVDAGTDPLDPNSFPYVGISPIEFLFGKTAGTTQFVISNHTGSSVTLPSAVLKGADSSTSPAGFSISNDGCAGALPAGQECTIEVNYPSSTNAAKTAFLQVDDANLTAFIHNYEGVREEAMRRMPPPIGALEVPTDMEVYYSQTIDWSILGYDDHNYTSYIALFDCTGAAPGACGESYSSPQRFAEGLHLQPTSVQTTGWTYKGQAMKKYDYSFTFIPGSEMSEIVIRFYYQNMNDRSIGLPSISNIIPGGLKDGNNESYDYYDTSGRKVSGVVYDGNN